MTYLPSTADLYGQAMQSMQGYGNAQQQELYNSYQNALGQGMQSLASTGLVGTTVNPSMRMGYMKQYQQSLNALGQQLQQQKLGAMSTFGLGGIQANQSQQQLGLSQQGLDINKRNAAVNEQQLALQKQQQQYNQDYQTRAYNNSYQQQSGPSVNDYQNQFYGNFNNSAAYHQANFAAGYGG